METENKIKMTHAPGSLSDAPSLDVAHAVFDILDAKKGKHLRVLHVADRTVISEYFVLCTAQNLPQMSAMADEVSFAIEGAGLPLLHKELGESGWIALDFGHVMVHIFNKENRDYYGLDRLYGDSDEVKFETIDERAEKADDKQ